MQIQDHDPIELEFVKGLFGRGDFSDTVPPDHLIDSLNTISVGKETKTRDGFVSGITLANIRRVWEYKRTGEASRLLVLDNTGKLWDTTLSLVTPILNIPAMTDFSAYSQYNRAYITPHNGVSGLPGQYVQVYNGFTCRQAAGTAPSSGLAVANSATAGNVEAGTHIFGVAFETDSGFITAPGQLTTLVTTGTKKVDITAIPIGPTGTAARRLVACRAIQDYNGDTLGYEMFLIPNGRIADNTTTSLTVNFYDADLQITCDYLFDQLSSIPAVVNITNLGSRLIYAATDTDKSLAYVSKSGEPESINAAAGFLLCDPSETEGLRNCIEHRDSLYLTKYNKLYVTRDNGYDASTWQVITIDKGVGANIFSISVIQDSKGANQDFFLLGDESGLFLFNGVVVRPELSYKILNWWNRINKAAFNKVQIIIDTKKSLVYVLVPLDSATSPSHIFVGDYSEGMDFRNIRWHIWGFDATAFAPACIAVGINNITKKTYLRIGGYDGNVYNQTVGTLTDNGVAIDCYMQFALLFEEAGWVHHFAGIELRIVGAGSLQLSLRGEDATSVVNLNGLTLASAPGREYFRHSNYNNEKCSIKLRTSGATEWFNLKHLKLFTRPIWATRPS